MKVTAWDAAGMKRALDEHLVEALVSAPDGIKENNIVVDIKLAIMFLSCLVGCVAQFYPMPFPDNRILLAAFFFLYFALSAAYQYYLWFIERDYIFATKEAAGRPSVSVRTNLPRSEDKIVADNEKLDKYGVIVECPKGKEVLSTAVSVGRFFTKKGEFDETGFQAFVTRDILPTVVSGAKPKAS